MEWNVSNVINYKILKSKIFKNCPLWNLPKNLPRGEGFVLGRVNVNANAMKNGRLNLLTLVEQDLVISKVK
jgi:hypothetical protein